MWIYVDCNGFTYPVRVSWRGTRQRVSENLAGLRILESLVNNIPSYCCVGRFFWDCSVLFVFKVVLTPWLHRKESHLRRRATARGVSGLRPHSTKGTGRRWCGMDVLGWVKPPTRLSYPEWDDMVLFPWVCVVAMFCLIVLLTAPGERGDLGGCRRQSRFSLLDGALKQLQMIWTCMTMIL
jgi:hypothetical protein